MKSCSKVIIIVTQFAVRPMDPRTGSLVPEHGSKSTRIGRDRVPVRHSGEPQMLALMTVKREERKKVDAGCIVLMMCDIHTYACMYMCLCQLVKKMKREIDAYVQIRQLYSFSLFHFSFFFSFDCSHITHKVQ